MKNKESRKKSYFVCLVILASLFPVVSFASSTIDANLSYKQKSLEVTKLQNFLIKKGLLTGEASGFFGSQTLAAVKNYQKSLGLPNNGYVGVLTRAKINLEISKSGGEKISQNSIPPVSLSTNLKSPKVGDTFIIELKAGPSATRPIYTLGSTLNYDPKKVSFVETKIDSGWLPLVQASYWVDATSTGEITRTAGISSGLTSQKTFVKYIFKALASGPTQITLSKGLAIDEQNSQSDIEHKSVSLDIK